jgi:homoserine acetyltransferase
VAAPRPPLPPPFEVESYLRYQGDKFIRRFDALCYVRLTQLLDTHDLGAQPAVLDTAMAPRPRGGHLAVLASLPQPALVVGIESDVLYPVSPRRLVYGWESTRAWKWSARGGMFAALSLRTLPARYGQTH